jgi:hypothetical protein
VLETDRRIREKLAGVEEIGLAGVVAAHEQNQGVKTLEFDAPDALEILDHQAR